MKKRIDHTEEARTHVMWAHDWQAREGDTPETGLAHALIAQAEATLALVEQQRIANLIALENQRWQRVSEVGNYFGPDVLRGNPPTEHDSAPLRPDIAAALGIEEE